MYICTQVSAEARGIRCPGVGFAGDCAPQDMGTGNQNSALLRLTVSHLISLQSLTGFYFCVHGNLQRLKKDVGFPGTGVTEGLGTWVLKSSKCS